MAKQTINIGSSANDGTGDPLRTAFDKINDNFDELYLYSTATSGNNITVTANTIASDNTNGNIILDPNGTGRVVLATASELRFTDHTDNAILFVDSDGDVTMSSSLAYDTSTGKVTIDDVLIGGQTISTERSNQDLKLDPAGTGKVDFITVQQSGVGSAGGATNVPAAPTIYAQIKVNGTAYVIPCFAVS
tara:strand:- start:778 stop:1347 length:570 start_codon:yes stop_codon:yes gene_type:complete